MALWRSRERGAPTVPDGTRVYAIGDVHGRLDLLHALLARIEDDDGARAPARTMIVMLGDLIDRGPDSAGVVELLLNRRPEFAHFHFLLGNHEQAMLDSLAEGTDPRTTGWLRYGGMEALRSYGVPVEAFDVRGPLLADELRRHVPMAHLEFLRGFEDLLIVGDYLFVHAGIRPGRPVKRQTREDLLWIREEFLTDERQHDYIVVHGHTIDPEPVIAANRIGIDTGAYSAGVLTCLGLEGSDRWILQARGRGAVDGRGAQDPAD